MKEGHRTTFQKHLPSASAFVFLLRFSRCVTIGFVVYILTSFVPPSDIFGHANSYQISNNTSYYSVYFPTKLIEHYNFCEGEVQTYDYLFKNAGQLPLVISSVRSGCGCYAASWPKDAIQAGDTGVIREVL